MPSVSQIASYAGVAKSTVSLVLNNKPGVSENMRRQVLNAANELRAREEVAQQTTPSAFPSDTPRIDNRDQLSIALLHPPILRSSQVFSEFLHGIQAGANAHHVQLRLATIDSTITSRQDHITRLYLTDPLLRPSGVLALGAHQHEPILDEVRKQGIPYVLVGRQTTDQLTSAAGRDEEAITIEAVNYLVSLGHKIIAFVGGEESYPYTLSRLQGYRMGLKAHNIEPQSRWVALGDGKSAAKTVLDASPDITAVIFINDAYAMEGLPVFQAAGRVIPDNLSIVSFDDTDEARTFNPPLTSISYPRFQEGYWAVRAVVEQIRNPLMQSFRVVFKSSLILRDSCSPPGRK